MPRVARGWVALVAVLTLCGVSRPASAAITFIASSSYGSTNTNGASSQASMNTTGANFLACAIADYNANSPSTITESRGSSAPTGYTTASSVTLVQVRIAYWVNYTSAGNPTTFTTNGTGTYVALACIAMANVDTTGSAFEAQSAGGTAAATTVQPGSLTPSVDNELLVTGLGANVDTSETINGGYGVNGGNPVTGGSSPGTSFTASIAYLIQTSKTAANPTWTGGDNTGRAARQATFLCGNCGGGGSTYHGLPALGVGK